MGDVGSLCGFLVHMACDTPLNAQEHGGYEYEKKKEGGWLPIRLAVMAMAISYKWDGLCIPGGPETNSARPKTY